MHADGGHTSWKMKVSAKVCSLETCGSTANAESPTKPRVALLKASRSTGRPRRGATMVWSDVRSFLLL
jgi:hypothetical protein